MFVWKMSNAWWSDLISFSFALLQHENAMGSVGMIKLSAYTFRELVRMVHMCDLMFMVIKCLQGKFKSPGGDVSASSEGSIS